jgi:ATP-binding cassette subfamily F protein 3
VLEIENGAITAYEGNYEDYLRRMEALATEASSTAVILSEAARSTAESKDPRLPFSSRNENSGRAFSSSPNTTILIEGGYEETNGVGRSPAARTRRLNPIKQKQIENRCAFLEEEIPRLEAALAHTEQQLGVYVSAAETQRLTTLAEELRAQLSALTAEWEELMAQLDVP